MSQQTLLKIQDLTITVSGENQRPIVDSVNLEIPPRRIFSLVGGSGSGKTTIALAILRLLGGGLTIQNGKIHFQQQDLLTLPEHNMREVRGKTISMIFQEPLYAFNPVFSIGYQVEEVLKYHTDLTFAQRKGRILDLLKLVGIEEPQRVASSYSHQLSGGMRQRAMIAQAIAANPQLVIADEPTSNLDVTLQAKIIELFRHLKDRLGLSILLITHDLGMVASMSDEVAVMTQGKIVEKGETQAVMNQPQHPYTQKLLQALRVY